MTRLQAFAHIALLGTALATPLSAQLPAPRSGDYLFATGTDDVRAMWVNPAGLARPVASLFAELAGARAADGGWRVGQYSIGLSSRNTALSYRRDRFEGQPGIGTLRVAAGFGFNQLSLGTGIELHQSRRSWDVGLQFFPTPRLILGAVLRNIGRPVVLGTALRLTGVASVSARLGRGALVSMDAVAVERRPAAGYDRVYRAGAQIVLPLRTPVTAVSALEFPSTVSGVRLARWSLGLSFGKLNQLVGVATTLEPEGAARQLDAFSLTAVARAATKAGSR